MDIVIKDDKFQSLYNLDIFESFIWTERYIGFGNFEFYTPMNQNMLEVIETIQKNKNDGLDCYVRSKEDNSSMFIEELQITTDTENGNHLIISGRGLETILERRIIWETKSFNRENIQVCLKSIIETSIIRPEISERKIDNFIFEDSDDPYIDSTIISIQCTMGDNLYDVVLKICEACQIGFDIYLNSHNQFVFKLNVGKDRTYDQNKNQYVVFSPKYENMINSDYLESSITLKNVSLVVGNDQYGFENKLSIIDERTSALGLYRKEMYTDASDIQLKEYEILEDDREELKDLQQNLEDLNKSLEDVTKEYQEKTTEHNKKVAEYNELITGHQNRKTAFESRIAYYNGLIDQYVSLLSSEEKTAYNKRKDAKSGADTYDKLIKTCDDHINRNNDRLQNDLTLTYKDIEDIESDNEIEEGKKADYQTTKTEFENKQKEEEEKLPYVEEELKVYEDTISKYKDIKNSDGQSKTVAEKDLKKENEDWVPVDEEYKTLISQYQTAINATTTAISTLETQIRDEETLLNDAYIDLLREKGTTELSENIYTRAFTSEIEATKMFVYGTDFFKGDVVQIVNEYGMEGKARITEIVKTQDTNGYSMYPTFQIM